MITYEYKVPGDSFEELNDKALVQAKQLAPDKEIFQFDIYVQDVSFDNWEFYGHRYMANVNVIFK